jgi:hypothetical protein
VQRLQGRPPEHLTLESLQVLHEELYLGCCCCCCCFEPPREFGARVKRWPVSASQHDVYDLGTSAEVTMFIVWKGFCRVAQGSRSLAIPLLEYLGKVRRWFLRLGDLFVLRLIDMIPLNSCLASERFIILLQAAALPPWLLETAIAW